MPNGRSDELWIPRERFVEFLRNLPSDSEIGHGVGEGLEDKPISAAEMIDLLQKEKDKYIFVEEQDRAWYIVHIDPEYRDDLISVAESSPLYPPLRHFHDEGLEEVGRFWVLKRPPPGDPEVLVPQLIEQLQAFDPNDPDPRMTHPDPHNYFS